MSNPTRVASVLSTAIAIKPERRQVILAIACAYAIPLPNSTVTDVQTMYNLNYKTKIDSILSKINESFFMELADLISTTRSFYLTRVKVSREANMMAEGVTGALTAIKREDRELIDSLVPLLAQCVGN